MLVGSQNFSVASLGYNRDWASSRTTRAPWPHRRHPNPRLRPGSVLSPPAASTTGARCTATASVYDASRDENNVYVHSNRPDQEATAKADGYSHSYRTDGSGYTLIYLNGPPPGARITVTVGGATCTTSD